MTQAVDLGGVRVETTRLVNENVSAAGRLDHPVRGPCVAAVDQPSTALIDHASQRATAGGFVVDQERGQPRASRSVIDAPSAVSTHRSLSPKSLGTALTVAPNSRSMS